MKMPASLTCSLLYFLVQFRVFTLSFSWVFLILFLNQFSFSRRCQQFMIQIIKFSFSWICKHFSFTLHNIFGPIQSFYIQFFVNMSHLAHQFSFSWRCQHLSFTLSVIFLEFLELLAFVNISHPTCCLFFLIINSAFHFLLEYQFSFSWRCQHLSFTLSVIFLDQFRVINFR